MLKKRVKGCFDIYPGSKEAWQDPAIWKYLDDILLKVAALYGFREARTPSFEYTEVFTRTSGQESDIVNKEMYTFLDKKDRSLTLRPELTAPVIRAYIENGGMSESLTKLFYKGPCYRYDRPQKGRYRQFHQFGIEVIGKKDPMIDIEVISMLLHLFDMLGLTKTTLLINSIGSIKTRAAYAKELTSFYSKFENDLSEDSKRRLKTNPMRILDSKDSHDKKINENAPSILDFLDKESIDHFNAVKEGLDSLGIQYKIDPMLVRGLDYYNDTVFELIRSDDLSAQNTLAAGGVYSGLVKLLGGKDIPGIGFALGLERVIQYLLEENVSIAKAAPIAFYFIGMSTECKKYLLPFAASARRKGSSAELFEGTSIKAGLKKASEKRARYAIILGDDEKENGNCKIKDLETREEKSIPLSSLISHLETKNTQPFTRQT
ncbi:MAG: Histidine--tRNA ligase [Chlamydiia bacterium]|nr:Histidine--tRNA ligase [Chlamydiia bacterium]MCH9618422.1 Histidine--tRNA ligase [Chlamydiia bacterium]MCH9623748.1 Histidine--tRNA ligase [Chlamydiia bacterium]